MQPASPGQIAVELEKLRAVFGFEAGAWATASGEMMDALADLPGDLLEMARAEYIRAATQETRFPRPGTLRALVRDGLRRRREAAYPAPVYVPPPERRQPTVEEIAKVDEMVKEIRGVASEFATAKRMPQPGKLPPHEDPEELRKAAIELGIWNGEGSE